LRVPASTPGTWMNATISATSRPLRVNIFRSERRRTISADCESTLQFNCSSHIRLATVEVKLGVMRSDRAYSLQSDGLLQKCC